MSDLDSRLKSEKILARCCETIARISRLSQLRPEITGMSIEEVDEFIKRTGEEMTAKFEEMTYVDIAVDMTKEILTRGGEDAKENS